MMGDFREASIEIERIIDDMQRSVHRQAKSRGVRASIEVRNQALDILKGQRSGKKYKVPSTYAGGGVFYTASAPGEAPAVRTGLFRISFKERPYIVKSNGNLIIHARAESRLKVGKHLLGDILENGTKKMKPRPYKEKTIQLALPRVLQIFNEPYMR